MKYCILTIVAMLALANVGQCFIEDSQLLQYYDDDNYVDNNKNSGESAISTPEADWESTTLGFEETTETAGEPVTDGSTTQEPVTDGSTTQEPVTDGSTTQNSGTDGPTTQNSGTDGPTTQNSGTNGPTTQDPVTDGTTTTVPKVKATVSGTMTTSSIKVNGNLQPWHEDLSKDTSDLFTNTAEAFKAEIEKIYQEAKIDYEAVKVKQFTKASTTLRDDEGINCLYDVSIMVNEGVSEADLQKSITDDVNNAIQSLSDKNQLGSFGSTPTNSVQVKIITENNNSSGLSDAELAGVIVGSVLGALIIIVLVGYIM